MFKHILNFLLKKNPLITEGKHRHISQEHVFIKEDGSTNTFLFGTTYYGKNSNVPLNERKPERIIEYEKSKQSTQ